MSNELFVTTTGTVTFPSVFRPSEFQGKENYTMNLLFDEDQMDTEPMTRLKDAVKAVAIEKWGKDNVAKKMKAGLFTSPFKEGDAKADASEEGKLEIYRGKTIVSAKSKFQPSLIDAKRQPILDEEQFYGGCEARMAVTLYPWEYMNKIGVSLNLNHIQKTADGERLGGGRAKAEDIFSEVETTDDNSMDKDFEI